MDNLLDSTDTIAASPGYLLAGDNHNIGNNLDVSRSWLDPQRYIDGADSAWKFIQVAALSGADSMYNSAATIGNIFGAEASISDTGKWISSLDSDLGKYYEQDREMADLAGFIITSFIPGLSGIKILNAGQLAIKSARAGFIGENLSKATGLLVPRTQMYVELAAKDIIASQATFTSINVNTVKALASGVYQNVLEAAAFETAVQATMFKSPILQAETSSDIIKNIAIGGLLGGAIGGAFEAARTFGGIKKLVNEANPESKIFSSRVLMEEKTPASQSIILNAADRDATPLPQVLEDTIGGTNLSVNNKLYSSKVERINNDIRASTNSMAVNSDTQVTDIVSDITHNLSYNNMLGMFIHSENIGRLSSTLPVETILNKGIKSLDTEAIKNINIKYIKLTGEGTGSILDEAPSVLNIADTVSVKNGKSGTDAVLDFVRQEKFSPSKSWNASSVEDHLNAEARYIYASHLADPIKQGAKIQYDDFPLLQKALKDKQLDIDIVNADGSVFTPESQKDLINHLINTKTSVAQELLEKAVARGEKEGVTDTIAKIVDMRRSALEGSPNPNNLDDYFARDAANRAHKELLVSNGSKTESDPIVDIALLPSVAKIGYNVPSDVANVSGNVLDGMVWLKTQQKLFQDTADAVFSKAAGNDILANAPKIPDSVLEGASQIGESGGLLSYANASYGKLGSYVQNIGANVTRKLKAKLRQETADTLDGPLVSMGNKQNAAIEFEVLNQKLANTSEQYVMDVSGEITGIPNTLVAKKIADHIGSGTDSTMIPLQAGAPEYFEVTNQETWDAISAHISRTDSKLQTTKEIRAAQGHEENKSLGVFSPIRPNPNDYPFVAFVKDEKVTGAGHTSMLHAASEKELQALVDRVPSEYKVYLKGQAEDFYKARDEYEYARTLNTNYIDHDLKNRGINSQFFPKTDPQKIVDSILQEHLRSDDVLAAELVRLKYQPQFDWLEDQGAQYSKLESSRYGNALSNAEKFGKNPYTDYIKTALDVSRASEYPLLHSFNKSLDTAVSKLWGNIKDTFGTAKSPEELTSINKSLQDAGYNNAYYDAATNLLANHTAPKAELSKFIRTSNSILSFFTLGSDMLNGVNNAIGATILRGTETSQILKAIKSGNSDIAGKLADISLTLPGTGDSVLSTGKLLANANKAFFSDGSDALVTQYTKEGLIKDGLQQFKQIQDDFTLRGTESVSDLNSRLSSAWDKAQVLSGKVASKGRVWSGNEFFEQYNRFISANVMHQLTDLAEQAGALSPAESVAYRNTFVNRVEGNTIASQRPVAFQGPVGQAIGLFQSYQFNLMQQLFRYVGEGTGKDAAMLLGLQGTMYGINGQPGFNFINQHIVGNLSGNDQHRDLYDAVYGIAGKTAGDFLTYGIPSSIIQTNLYSRGDINPRQITVVPNSLNQVPIVGAYGKLFSTMKDTVDRIGAGGNVWENVLQGIEHNGISRPLAGIAQVAQSASSGGKVYSTTTKGSILYSNDLMSIASLSRLVGGRPLDEAIINDGMYRINAYEISRKAERDNLDQAIKSSVIQGNVPEQDQVEKFAAAYVATGGKQVQFNQHMMKELISANTPRSEKIRAQLSSPFSQKMQILMGGRDTGYQSPDSME